MSAVTDHTNDQARFAARELLAKFVREMGGEVSAVVADRMLFAFEMGYLRCHGDGMRAAGALYDELRKEGER
jgi:hypothetical protein